MEQDKKISDPFLKDNIIIENAIANFKAEETTPRMDALLGSIRIRMWQGGHFMIPVIPPESFTALFDPETLTEDLPFLLCFFTLNNSQRTPLPAVALKTEPLNRHESKDIILQKAHEPCTFCVVSFTIR